MMALFILYKMITTVPSYTSFKEGTKS